MRIVSLLLVALLLVDVRSETSFVVPGETSFVVPSETSFVVPSETSFVVPSEARDLLFVRALDSTAVAHLIDSLVPIAMRQEQQARRLSQGLYRADHALHVRLVPRDGARAMIYRP